ncbi:MAG: putative transport system permease protein, partial [Actinomycetota bacterium]|nr:putative transport system permease protein [Actinomycetota bacterium]
GTFVTYVAGLRNADWEFALNAPEDTVIGRQIESERILRGRFPNTSRANEVVVNEASVQQAHVDVGSHLDLATLTPAQRLRLIAGDPHAFDHGPLGPDLRLEVVGVARGVNSVVGRADPSIFATPAFDHAYRGRVAYSSRVIFARRASGVSAGALHSAITRLTAQHPLGVFDAATEDKSARQTTRTLSVGLLVFGLVAALASILVVGQAVARHAAGSEPDQPALVAMGMTRPQRIRGIVGSAVPIALFGALFAALGSVAASPIMPLGLARRIEPEPGVRFDAVVTGAAVALVVAVVIAASLLAAMPLTRRRRLRSGAARTSRVAAGLGAAGASPVLTTGAQLAFDRRPPALPVRSALLGVGGAVAVVVAALTFSASLDRLAGEPKRWGFGWDLSLDTTADGTQRLTRELAANPQLDGVSLLSTNFTLAEHVGGIRAYGLSHVDGTVGYALRSGRQPVGADEVVIGPDTARQLHLRVGSSVNVAKCPCTGVASRTVMGPVRVVGIALFPEGDDGNFTTALGFTGTGFARHVGDSETTRARVSIAPGRTTTAVGRELSRRYPGQLSRFGYPSRPGEVQNVVGLRNYPRVLAVFTALLGLAALQNVLVTTLRRRRRELATLRTLGLTPRQTSRCITWQSVSLTGIALAVGLPVGAYAGAEIWTASIRSIGVATDPNLPGLAIAAVALVAFLIAVAASIPVGWQAAHIRPAVALRSE